MTSACMHVPSISEEHIHTHTDIKHAHNNKNCSSFVKRIKPYIYFRDAASIVYTQMHSQNHIIAYRPYCNFHFRNWKKILSI